MSKSALIFLIAVGICCGGIALAQSVGGGSGISVTRATSTSGGGGGGGGGCTNKLDFSVACNSQYVGTL